MKKNIRLYSIALLGVAATVAITQALDQKQRIPIVEDLPAYAGELNMTHLVDKAEPGEELAGGATTVRDTGTHAFGRVPMNLTNYDTNWVYFREGRKVFDRNWYAIRKNHLLLGPHYSAASCGDCHKRDGRGRPPLGPEEEPISLILRLSIPHGSGTLPEPTYGEQLSYYSVDSVTREGTVNITYEEIEGRFADGSTYSLRVPTYKIQNLGYGPLASDVQVSPRVAPANFGLGLLGAIPEQMILMHADPDDRNGDGISGRANYVRDSYTGKEVLGRFGWKANQPTVAQQILKAFNADIGITSTLYPDDGGPRATTVKANATSDHPEVSDKQFDALLFYMELLAPPQRRDWNNPVVQRGKTIFRGIGCAGCHTPLYVTPTVERYPELSHQTIRPYTDMLIHDMGEGLADNRPDGLANGQEWRTPPLWGVGLVKAVSYHTFFLHDGRARNLEEAVLWHGGEAAASQKFYRRLNKDDRKALLAFLESL